MSCPRHWNICSGASALAFGTRVTMSPLWTFYICDLDRSSEPSPPVLIMSHNSAAGHWFKVGSWTVAGLRSFSRVAAARRIPSLLGSNLLMRRRNYYVYIMSSLSRTLYTGVTNDLERRVGEHKEGKPGSFTSRYKVNRLVYFEEFSDINQAIAREKEIKSMTRRQKIKLIESINPEWRELSQE